MAWLFSSTPRFLPISAVQRGLHAYRTAHPGRIPNPGPVDGIYGARTRAALERFVVLLNVGSEPAERVLLSVGGPDRSLPETDGAGVLYLPPATRLGLDSWSLQFEDSMVPPEPARPSSPVPTEPGPLPVPVQTSASGVGMGVLGVVAGLAVAAGIGYLVWNYA